VKRSDHFIAGTPDGECAVTGSDLKCYVFGQVDEKLLKFILEVDGGGAVPN